MILKIQQLKSIIDYSKAKQQKIILLVVPLPKYEQIEYRKEYATYLYIIKLCKFYLKNDIFLHSNQFKDNIKKEISNSNFSKKILYEIINYANSL